MARILIVDDSPTECYKLREILEKHGHHVLEAANGADGVAMARSELPDLVLMDVMMPEMDGYEATRQIRQQARWNNLPIIAVTAKAMKDDQERCREAGANDYLAKPIDLDRLFSLIRVWMPKLERL